MLISIRCAQKIEKTTKLLHFLPQDYDKNNFGVNVMYKFSGDR